MLVTLAGFAHKIGIQLCGIFKSAAQKSVELANLIFMDVNLYIGKTGPGENLNISQRIRIKILLVIGNWFSGFSQKLV